MARYGQSFKNKAVARLLPPESAALAMLQWLGVKPSYSRPRVSDDNAYAESLFRTAKYRPEFPAKGFANLAAARSWAVHFVRWYNVDHRHSGIRYVSPAQRHAGNDHEILAAMPCSRRAFSRANTSGWDSLMIDLRGVRQRGAQAVIAGSVSLGRVRQLQRRLSLLGCLWR